MSTHYLALDIGSTTVVAIVIDLDTNCRRRRSQRGQFVRGDLRGR